MKTLINSKERREIRNEIKTNNDLFSKKLECGVTLLDGDEEQTHFYLEDKYIGTIVGNIKGTNDQVIWKTPFDKYKFTSFSYGNILDKLRKFAEI